MRLLLDTDVFLWYISANAQLPVAQPSSGVRLTSGALGIP